MNKAELVEKLAKKTGLTKKDARAALDGVVEVVTAALKKNEPVIMTTVDAATSLELAMGTVSREGILTDGCTAFARVREKADSVVTMRMTKAARARLDELKLETEARSLADVIHKALALFERIRGLIAEGYVLRVAHPDDEHAESWAQSDLDLGGDNDARMQKAEAIIVDAMTGM